MSVFSLKFDNFSPEVQLRQVKASIIRQDLPQILKREQAKGFPKKYDLLLRQKGRETKRQISTLSPDFFNIGTLTRPTEINFVAGEGTQTMIEAIEFASRLFIRRAPFETGRYQRSAQVWIDGIPRSPGRLRPETFKPGSVVQFGPTTEYASTIEAGHHTGYYNHSLRGGIVRYVAQTVRDKYGASISVRMTYRPYGKKMIPIIEFGPAGAFTFSLGNTGANAQRRARSSRRRR